MPLDQTARGERRFRLRLHLNCGVVFRINPPVKSSFVVEHEVDLPLGFEQNARPQIAAVEHTPPTLIASG